MEAELHAGYQQGYQHLHAAVQAIEAGAIEVWPATAPYDARPVDDPLVQRLDRGEAEALIAARATVQQGNEHLPKLLVTDELDARQVTQNPATPETDAVTVTGSLGLLVRGITQGDLSNETAEEWLTTGVELVCGGNSGVRTAGEVGGAGGVELDFADRETGPVRRHSGTARAGSYCLPGNPVHTPVHTLRSDRHRAAR